jgi:hypothetical protein
MDDACVGGERKDGETEYREQENDARAKIHREGSNDAGRGEW